MTSCESPRLVPSSCHPHIHRLPFHAVVLCKGKSTLHQAAAQRDARMVALLLHAAETASGAGDARPTLDYVNCTSRDGWTALQLAARAGDATIVKALLDAGADRTAVMRSGKTALDLARLNEANKIGSRKTDGAVVKLLESEPGNT